ncbi:autotransporter domain-containing protein [Aquibium carbonis]|uniref:Autotransporter domain-containing protein n=1 Tax=Aquibium carbonis TaxID=2495581 RepID=A0A429Z001_9HYPH|nr:autotransporter domain-containing protein [Aquibium carbonis]RST86918.1 autotransporter domain-containing protein [Aquibium carbonis]
MDQRRTTRALLSGAALGTVFLALGMPAPAEAACLADGTTLTCTGDLGAGVIVADPIERLEINGVTAMIAPAEGVSGIDFQSSGVIAIVSDTGAYQILATDADGIHADSWNGSITIEHTGDIRSVGGYGVRTISLAGTSVTVDGDIEASLGGIVVNNDDAGTTTEISHTGDILVTEGAGISAVTSSTPLVVVNEGSINASGDGISAVNTSESGSVTVTQTGNVIAGDRGIHADAAFGSVTLTSAGNISSVGDGIQLLSTGSDVTATHTGNVTSTEGRGIFLDAPTAGASLSGSGTIQSYGDGIFAQSTGVAHSTSVTWTGNITSEIGKGIYAYAANGAVTVLSAGDIVSSGDSIFAMNVSTDGTAEDVSVTHTGDLTSNAGNGVYAYTAGGQVDVTVNNSILTASGYGIFAQTKGTAVDDDVTVEFNGTIAQSWIGILAEANTGTVLVTSSGEIAAWDHGIWAANTGGGNVTVSQTGGIDAGTGHAIYAYSPHGAVSVTATGDMFRSGMTAFYVETKSGNAATVNVTGDIVSGDGGITALSAQGTVTVTMRGDIDAGADGIYAESKDNDLVKVDTIGDITAGGSAIFAASSQGVVDVDSIGNLSAGGYGIYAANLGDNVVTVNSTGNIDAGNRGIHAQSATQAVTIVTSGAVTSGSDAVFAESLGGNIVSITSIGNLVAGTDGDGIYAFSATGTVTVTSTGDIDAGDDGIFARSTGGQDVSVTSLGDIGAGTGYGIYGYSATGAVTIGSTGEIVSGDHGIYALNLGYGTVGVTQVGDIDAGGSGIRATSTAGIVSVSNKGNIDAGGDGIYALTLGYEAATVTNEGYIDANGYGIHGHSDAGSVTIDNKGAIWSGSDGIRATTLSSSLVKVTQLGDIDSGGYGVFVNAEAGDADIDTTGDITSVNHGIYVLTNGNTLIDIDHRGSITSTSGNGITATSVAQATIDVSVSGGTVSGALDGIRLASEREMTVTVGADASVIGGAGNAGVRFVEGLGIQLTNRGSISNAGGIDEWAIVSAQNDTTVDNYGTIAGNVLLGPWSNPFNNFAGALFNMGSTVNIGADSTLSNHGTLSPGGEGVVQTTTLTGILVNEATGTLLFDVDIENATTDRLNVTNTAALDGNLRLNFVSATGTPGSYTIVTTGEGVTSQSLTLLNPFVLADIATVNNGNDVELSIHGFDFSPAGMSENASSIGNAIQTSIQGNGALEPIAVALLNLQTPEEAEDAFEQLSPNTYVADQIGSVDSIATFSNSMLSCRMASGENAFGAEGECAWGRAVYSAYDLAANGDNSGFNSRSVEMMGGVQVAVPDTAWRLGGSVGFQASEQDGNNGSSSEGSSFTVGAVAKYAPGPYLFAASVAASRGNYDTLRPIDIGNFTDLLSGETDVTTVSGRLRAAYTMEQGAFYLRPMVDASATYVRTGAFTETGGVASLSVGAVENTVLALMPAIEIGGQVSVGEDMLLRPYLRGGASVYSGNEYSLTGSFTADGNAAAPFTVTSSSEDVLWTVSTGVDLLRGDVGTLQIFYEGAFGEHTTINSGGAKFSVNF